jgi:hypothetical protein
LLRGGKADPVRAILGVLSATRTEACTDAAEVAIRRRKRCVTGIVATGIPAGMISFHIPYYVTKMPELSQRKYSKKYDA